MNLKETYNKIATDWHKDHQADDWWVEGTDKFISFLGPGDSVLDVGCGGGTKSRYLSKKGLKVTGIDFSDELINIAKIEVPQAEFIVMDMYNAEKLNMKFDGIFAQASLLHIPKKDLSNILRILASKLKPDGFLYVAVKGTIPGSPEEETKEEDDYGYPYQRFFSYYSMDELIKNFENLGLKIVYKDIKTIGKTDWLQIIGENQ
jgi:SAM-dependent methyltransferase